MPKIKALYGRRSRQGTDEDLVRVVDDQGGELKLTRVDFDAWKQAHPAATPQDAEEFIVAHFAELEDCDVYVHVHDLAESRVAVLVAREGLEVEPNWWTPDTIGRYEKFEVTFQLPRTDYTNPFDPDEIAVDALITSPSGILIEVPAFYYQDCEKSSDGWFEIVRTIGSPMWKVRFAPEEIGTYHYRLRAVDNTGTILSDEYTFESIASDNHGFVQVGPSGRYFRFSDGTFYYPVGVNTPYPGSYPLKGTDYYTDDWFPPMGVHGWNLARIFMISYTTEIEWTNYPDLHSQFSNLWDGIGIYSLENAWKLDRIFESARQHGINIQPTLIAWHEGQWDTNPYNSANGGPASSRADFFTGTDSKEYFKKKLRYLIARYGYSTNLFSWELVNETHWITDVSDEAMVSWHSDISSYIKAHDPYGHLVTTSDGASHHPEWWGDCDLWLLDNIDYCQPHIYFCDHVTAGDSVSAAFTEPHSTWYDQFNKPNFLGEFGLGLVYINDGPDSLDTQQVSIHNVLWLSLMLGHGATPLYWWTTEAVIDEIMHWEYGQHFQAFMTGLNLEGSTAITVTVDDEGVEAYGRSLNTGAIVWVHNLESKWDGNPGTKSGLQLTISDLEDGDYDVELWDTWSGTVMSQEVSNSTDGSMTIPLPDFIEDIALKIEPHGI